MASSWVWLVKRSVTACKPHRNFMLDNDFTKWRSPSVLGMKRWRVATELAIWSLDRCSKQVLIDNFSMAVIPFGVRSNDCPRSGQEVVP